MPPDRHAPESPEDARCRNKTRAECAAIRRAFKASLQSQPSEISTTSKQNPSMSFIAMILRVTSFGWQVEQFSLRHSIFRHPTANHRLVYRLNTRGLWERAA